MPNDHREQRGQPRVVVLVLAAVLIPAAIGLATEALEEHLPDVRSGLLWSVLGVLVVAGVALVIVGNRPGPSRRRRPGRPVRAATAKQLEVHEAVKVAGPALPEQTRYVPRAHDERLAAAVQQAAAGMSVMVTLVGDSSTGKTRACYEAVQTLPKRWRLWHPLDPSRPEALLESLDKVCPHTARGELSASEPDPVALLASDRCVADVLEYSTMLLNHPCRCGIVLVASDEHGLEASSPSRVQYLSERPARHTATPRRWTNAVANVAGRLQQEVGERVSQRDGTQDCVLGTDDPPVRGMHQTGSRRQALVAFAS